MVNSIPSFLSEDPSAHQTDLWRDSLCQNSTLQPQEMPFFLSHVLPLWDAKVSCPPCLPMASPALRDVGAGLGCP